MLIVRTIKVNWLHRGVMPEYGAMVYALPSPKAIACKHNTFIWCQGICLALPPSNSMQAQ